MTWDRAAMIDVLRQVFAHQLAPLYPTLPAWAEALIQRGDTLTVEQMEAESSRQIFRDRCMVLRCAITGSMVSPPLFGLMEVLGREECLARIADAIHLSAPP